MVGSETGLTAVEVTAPVEPARASGHVPIVGARALTSVGWATIIIAALIDRPAPPLVVHSRLMPMPLVNAHQTADGSPLPAVPARNMSCDGTAQPVFETAAGAGLC